MSVAFYNEIDPYAAQWLRNLIAAGHIAPGVVDERSIEDVTPDDLRPFTQCHFFAGIGVWSHALRRAGWADDRPVWTGSCPCQPFSAAGKGAGFADERHLWPHFHWLIGQCRPDVVLGEQVASKDGLGWLDLVQADLEGTGYASGAVDLCAAGVGACHIRQRLWWFGKRRADAIRIEEHEELEGSAAHEGGRGSDLAGGRGMAVSGRLADATLGGRGEERSDAGRVALGDRAEGISAGLVNGGVRGGLADADEGRQRQRAEQRGDAAQSRQQAPCGDDAGRRGPLGRPGPTNGLWRDADWLFCRDGKWRPVEPGTFPLAHGAASRVGRLRAYGNEIVAEAATAFIEAYLDAENELGGHRHAA